MTRTDIRENVILALKQILKEPIDELSDQDELLNFGFNSSRIMLLMMKIEEVFKVRFDEDDFDWRHYQTIKSLVDFIDYKINKSEE